MIDARAIKGIFKYGRIVGYTLQDMNGTVMDVPTNSIIQAMRDGKINVTNLVINSAGNLSMTSDKVIKAEPIKKPEAKPVHTEAKPVKTAEKPVKTATLSQARRMEVQNTGKTENYDKLGRMNHLVKTLNEARRVYEQGHDELMSNFEYDKLYDELEALEKETGVTLSNSPTVNIGYEVVSELPKETHKETMMSLGKTKSVDEVVDFIGNKEAFVGWKLDGLTVVAYYNHGCLIKAVTRGNGTVGELITPNFKQFKNIPHKIPYNFEAVIRGEAIITYSSFNRINEGIPVGEKYKNPRNLASGSVRQLDSRITASRDVRFKAFTLVNALEIGLKTVEDSYKWMKKQGFEVVDSVKVTKETARSVIDNFTKAVEGKKIDIPVDGLVITYNDIAYGKSLGTTAKTPRHSMALKWEDEVVETRLRYIEWSASKTGLLNPVAVFDPVDIEGSTVSRASLHNVSVLYDTLGQPYVGQRIKVFKANMIIPQILWGEKLEQQ